MDYSIKKKIEFIKYQKMYYKNYYDDEKRFINSNIFKNNDSCEVDLLAQIYSRIGVFNEYEDRYLQYVKLLSNEFSLCGNILEVGAGRFPIVSYHLSKIKCRKGTITAYDPRLVTNELEKIKLVKKNFTMEDDIEKYDLIIGFAPCDATETIIRQACKNKKDFSIATCGCTIHFPLEFYKSKKNYTEQEWFDYLYLLASEIKSEDCLIDIKYLPSSFNYKYPIIQGKHIKTKKL